MSKISKLINSAYCIEEDDATLNLSSVFDGIFDEAQRQNNSNQLKQTTAFTEQKIRKHNGEEVVEHPDHYKPRADVNKMKHIIDRIVKRGYIEAIDVIDAWNLNFNCGSAIKYILRLGQKDDELTEIGKAITYLNFEKDMLEAASTKK